ncbi:MAG: phosphate ABC transporter ATP-binding protein [Candidatus Wallbacteria bacterium]|nr:phosphate ABC transporter ATP-binding protein [Candidatus Wallbacteria bacterium]
MNKIKIQVRNFSVSFNGKTALSNLNLDIYENERLAIIGPAGSGKTSFLRALNRLNDLNPGFTYSGKILLDGKDIYDSDTDVAELRRRVGMVYAVPVALPWTIRENLAFGLKLSGITGDSQNQRIENALREAFLWEEVKDRLDQPAFNLSGGQQQRMSMARMLALQPDVLLFDEPCSALDPIATARIEDALETLREKHTIILVTNNTKQAARASDRTAFFLMGELVEISETHKLFTRPEKQRTNEYLIGQFG